MSSVLPDIKFNLSLVISDQDGIMNTFQYTRTLRAGQLQEGRTSFFSGFCQTHFFSLIISLENELEFDSNPLLI